MVIVSSMLLKCHASAYLTERPPQVHSHGASPTGPRRHHARGWCSLSGAVNSLFRLSRGDFLHVLFFSEESDLGQEDKHIVDRAVAPEFPISRLDVSRVRGGVVVPAHDMEDRARRQQRGHILFVDIASHPIMVVAG